MATYDWSFARPVKRLLSVYEKRSLPTTSGRALIMPAEPHTEVEELVAAGYVPDKIICIEDQEAHAQALYQHYAGFCQVYNEDIGQFMAEICRVPKTITYVHLDYNGHIKADVEVKHLSYLPRLLAPVSRVRISMLLNRKLAEQKITESYMRNHLLTGFTESMSRIDPVNEHDWATLRDQFDVDGDITQVVAALMLLQLFFGEEYWAYAATTGEDTLPALPKGRHLLTNVNRFEYNDDHNVMSTLWLDTLPMPELPLLESPMWRYRYLLEFYKSLSEPVIPYNPLSRIT